MTSSGQYSYAISNGEVVLAAYERLKVFPPELTARHMQSARREMNLLLAYAANRQVNLWKVDQVSVTLSNTVATYDVDPSTVMILDAWITVNNSSPQSANDLYITPVSRTEYASFSNKNAPGRPTCYWFDRLISPTITMWPVPDASGPYVLKYYRVRQMQDANLPGGETPDIPYLWFDWFVAGLAHRLTRGYGPADQNLSLALEKQRKMDADEAWTVAATQNVENTPLTLSPMISSYYRR
jgi:hypothetical protein